MWFVRAEVQFHGQTDLMLVFPFPSQPTSLHSLPLVLAPAQLAGSAAILIRKLIKLNINNSLLWGQSSFLSWLIAWLHKN